MKIKLPVLNDDKKWGIGLLLLSLLFVVNVFASDFCESLFVKNQGFWAGVQNFNPFKRNRNQENPKPVQPEITPNTEDFNLIYYDMSSFAADLKRNGMTKNGLAYLAYRLELRQSEDIYTNNQFVFVKKYEDSWEGTFITNHKNEAIQLCASLAFKLATTPGMNLANLDPIFDFASSINRNQINRDLKLNSGSTVYLSGGIVRLSASYESSTGIFKFYLVNNGGLSKDSISYLEPLIFLELESQSNH